MARQLLAPLLGLLFVVLLPFVGLAMLAQIAFRAVARRARRGAEDLAATLSPGWRPGEAHLTGRRAQGGSDPEVPTGGAGEDALRVVADEIATRRRTPGESAGD
jgi:hypothetical protein